MRERRDAKARRRAAYLSRMPKNRWKRILFRLKPRELARYWFSRDGAIMALKILGIGIVVFFILVVGLFAFYRKNLPDLKNISGTNIGGSITYYDRTGTQVLFQDYDSDKRIPVESNQISPYMNEATVSIEDRSFYSEGAFNIKGIIRAAVEDLFGGGGGGLQGGSTITQQLVKLNMGWTSQRTLTHKVEELILAVDISRTYSKQEILTGYENIAPYGNIEYGVEAAAEDYFHIHAAQLSLAQAAMLASIPQDPPYYSPYSSPQYNPSVSVNNFDASALITRQHYVLDQMVKSKYITQAQADAAKKVDVLSEVQPLESKYDGIQYPYYVLAAKQQLEQKYGATTVSRGGWKVTTALDTNLENEAIQNVTNNLSNVKKYGGNQEAMVGEQVSTGQIVMLVGGVNFEDPQYGQINYATTLTSPGSSFKPMDYVSLINDTTDAGAGSVLYDGTPDHQPEALTGYPCTDKTRPTATSTGGNCLWDYDYYFPGAEQIRYALAGSRNVPAVKAMLTVGTNKVIATADAMMDISASDGYQCYSDAILTKPDQCYGASAIGDGAFIPIADEVNYDASLARLGQAIPTTFILKITDASNNTLYQWTPPKPTQVVRTDAAYIIDNILSDPNASYLNKAQKFQNWNGWDIAVKTGTEFYNHHGLMTAWDTQYAVVSWVGTDTDTTNMTAGHMEDVTEPLTRTWMEYALNSLHTTPKNWTQPSDIQTLPAYVQTNAPAVSSGAVLTGKSTDIFPSWYVPKSGTGNTSTKYDLVSGGLATSCTPPLATHTVTTTSASQFSADIFYNASGSSASTTTTSIDNVHNCSDSKPTVTVTPAASADPGDYDFTVTVTKGTDALSGGSYTASPAGTLALLVNNSVIQTVNIPTDAADQASFTYTFTNINVPNGDAVAAQAVDSVLYETQTSPSPSTAPF
jgi:penicillin-binding protein 1A